MRILFAISVILANLGAAAQLNAEEYGDTMPKCFAMAQFTCFESLEEGGVNYTPVLAIKTPIDHYRKYPDEDILADVKAHCETLGTDVFYWVWYAFRTNASTRNRYCYRRMPTNELFPSGKRGDCNGQNMTRYRLRSSIPLACLEE